jgi:hypothetical protein
MGDLDREPLEGAVKVDQKQFPFREGEAFRDRCNVGKIRVFGAVEATDHDTHQSKPRRKHATDLEMRSGRVRLAMTAGNSGASIEALGKANVMRGL